MKNIVKSGLFAFALAAFAVQPSFAQEAPAAGRAPDPVSYGYTVLRVGIGTPVSLPWGFDWDIFGLDVNLLYSDANKMDGIGTVIAVYGSQNGGGYFVFGGGEGASAGAGTRFGDVWNRGSDPQQEGSSYRYSVQMFGAQALSSLYYARVYFDGYSGNARYTGFNGDWQVVTMKADTTTDGMETIMSIQAKTSAWQET